METLIQIDGTERVGISGVNFAAWGQDTQQLATAGNIQQATAYSGKTTGVQKATEGFQWNDHDNSDPDWYPQGFTVNRDHSSIADGHGNVELISASYSKRTEGARVTLVQHAADGRRKYVHVLLVQEKGLSGCSASEADISEFYEPLWKYECGGQVHVGGITVSPDGKFLLAADSRDGIRGFELGNIF